jgi:hypothetical protein
MLTPSDIAVLVLLVGSGIFIWIARRSSLDHPKDTPRTHDYNESPPSAEQMETHDETNKHTQGE